MNETEAACRILEILKHKKQVLVLRDLAKQAGFKTASAVDFKKGFNFLQKKGVVKLRQSGWRSEKRGGRVHPKSVILLADIYVVESVEQEIKEELGIQDEKPTKDDGDSGLVAVLTLSGDPTFISKATYEETIHSKDRTRLIDFWEPKKSCHRRLMSLPPRSSY